MNDRARRSQVLLAAILLLSGSGHALAQDAYLARWQALHVRQPEAMGFLISAPKSEFYQGELIPLQLSFTSTQPKGFLADTRLQDRVGRLNGMEEFLIDPAALVEDPLRGLPGESGGMGGPSGGEIPLSGKPFSFEKLLNGRHQVLIDRPVAKGGSDAGPMGGELFLAAVGGCFMSNLLAAIKAREAEIGDVRVEVVGVLADSPARFAGVELRVAAERGDRELFEGLVEIADRGCIMMNTLRGKLEVRVLIGAAV